MQNPPSEPTFRLFGLLRPVRLLVYALFVLLLASAAVTLTGVPALEQGVRQGRAARLWLVAPVVLFGLFTALFALYRFLLVRGGRYHAGKAFVQVGLMALVLALLVPNSLGSYRSAGVTTTIDLGPHLASSDPEIRALSAELARWRPRPEGLSYVPRLIVLLQDPAPEVRRQAHDTLVALAGGQDPAGDRADAPARWRDWWEAHGAGASGK